MQLRSAILCIIQISYLCSVEHESSNSKNINELFKKQCNAMVKYIIEDIESDLSNLDILDKDKFVINTYIDIVDTIIVDSSIYHVYNVVDSTIGHITAKVEYPQGEEIYLNQRDSLYSLRSTGIAISEILAPYLSTLIYLIYKPRISILVDNSIKLENYYNPIKDIAFKKLNSKLNQSQYLYDYLPVDYSQFDDIITIESADLVQSINDFELSRSDIYDDSWAVIIGIDKYENLSNLDYAVADAEAVKDMLINKFDYPEKNVKLLLNEEANKTNIVNIISDVSLKAGEDDRILVFYAGHGETMDLPAGGEMGFLLPVDGNENNLYASAIRMDDLKDFSYLSKSKHMLFLVDACYGGLAAVGTRSLEQTNTPNYLEKISNIKSRQIITAGGKEEKVVEKSEWGHSAYTKNLLSGLNDELADINEDGYITALELGSYLSEKVTFDSESRQTPQLRRLTSDEGEFVFFGSSNNGSVETSKANIYKSNNNDLGAVYEMSPKNTWKAIQGFQRSFIVSTEKSGAEGLGFISSADRYLNNGKQILSFSGEWSFYEHQSNKIYYHIHSIYIQNHLTSLIDLMWTYGAGIIVTEFFTEQPHFGYTVFVGFLRLGQKLKFNKKVSQRFNHYGEVRIGYRFMPGESDYIMQSGIVLQASIGLWQRRLPK